MQFISLPFEDRDNVKWICHECAAELPAIADGPGFNFSDRMKRLSKDGQCGLCHKNKPNKVIQPYPHPDWESTILIERGFSEPSNKGSFSMFKPKENGYVHYWCMDEINVELWRLIERTDVPDYGEWLRSCG